SADKKKYLTSIWRIDVQGGPARRLTRSAEGEGSPRFLPDGSLLFVSRRPLPPDPDRAKDGDNGDVTALWLLPAAGGEARRGAGPGGWPRCRAGSAPPRWPGTPAASWSARRSFPPRGTATARATTPGCAVSARTPGSPPSCTSPRRSGSGTTTWVRTSPG